MSTYKDINITHNFLDQHPNAYFIYGDNLQRQGCGGAAKLRDHPHAIGFITKKFPDNHDTSFYTVNEYKEVFEEELQKLKKLVKNNPSKIFYISQLGGGLANKYRIWENLIKENLIKSLEQYENVIFCWKECL